MTLEQIFYRFCKEENVYDDIVKAINNECEAFNSRYKMITRNATTPRKVLMDKINFFGYRDFIAPLMGFTWSKLLSFIDAILNLKVYAENGDIL